MRKLILALLVSSLTIIVFAEKVADMKELTDPRNFLMDEQDMIITDQFEIQIYSLNDFKFKTRFGKKGRGPGEFGEEPTIHLLPDSTILAFALDKCAWFSKDGTLIKERRLEGIIRNALPFKENFVFGKRFISPDLKSSTMTFVLMNPEFKPIKDIYKTNYDISIPQASGFKELDMMNHTLEMRVYGDKLYIADSQKGFYIESFDTKGEHVFTIEKSYKRLETDEKFKKDSIADFQLRHRGQYDMLKSLGVNFTFDQYFPSMFNFSVEDGKVYVITYQMKDDNHEMLILNEYGDLLKQLFLPLKSLKFYEIGGFNRYQAYIIKKGILYELIENIEAEMWELHKTKIE